MPTDVQIDHLDILDQLDGWRNKTSPQCGKESRKGLNKVCYKSMVIFKDLIKEKRDHELLDGLIKAS